MPRDNRDVHVVSLPRNCPEFVEVSQMFFATVEGVTITSIERIQNPWLYQTYSLTKEKVDKNNGGENERRLFHATSFERVKCINSQGFKRNQSKEHGELIFMSFSDAGGPWRHQQWSPSWPLSWILSRIRNQVKTARNGNFFFALNEK